MCTVTIIPKGKNDFILTSNRDEAPDRLPLIPDFYTINETKLLFPKDVKGGTWIGISEKNRVVCILNGGYINHKKQERYRMSRGIVANDFMLSNDIVPDVESYNLDGVEPFTMVIADWNPELKFYELVWDGYKKHFTQLPLAPKIWSSSTLYTEMMKQERLQWFNDYKSNVELNAGSLLNFHKTAGDNNDDYGVVMNRGSVKTTSVTQIEKHEHDVNIRFENIVDKSVAVKTFNLPEVVNG
ncbi:NRDE family protein [uncultured Algibacter sp.]|uniref:NRDE family protein n=1 Tax=uncultured Algibacter sp. TaxID=298659 RepID=UPI0032173F52